MGRPVVISKQLGAASANGIALSQSGTAGTALTLNGASVSGGVANLGSQRRVIVTSAGNDSGITFTIVGVDDTGGPRVEQLTGGNVAAAQSALDYAQVLSVTPSGATASTVTVGTNGVGSSPWVRFDPHIPTPNLGLSYEPGASPPTVTAEYTFDEFLLAPGFQPSIQNLAPIPAPTVYACPNINAVTTQTTDNLTLPITGYRLTINSGAGIATLVGIQGGISGP